MILEILGHVIRAVCRIQQRYIFSNSVVSLALPSRGKIRVLDYHFGIIFTSVWPLWGTSLERAPPPMTWFLENCPLREVYQ